MRCRVAFEFGLARKTGIAPAEKSCGICWCLTSVLQPQCKGLVASRVADIKALDQATFNSKHVTDYFVCEKVSV